MKVKMNLPNRLTIMRIVLAPIFLLLFLLKAIPYNCILSLVVFIGASVTDFADGKIARARNLITNFGKIADPIADKILTTTVLLCFMQRNLCSIWVIIIILAREFVVSAIRITAASQGAVIPANVSGKIKTVLQMVFSIVLLVLIAVENDFAIELPWLSFASGIMTWILAAVTIISGAIYIKDGAKIIDFTK